MRLLKAIAVIGALVGGAVGLSGPASASPLVSGAMPAAKTGDSLVAQTQFYEERRIYRPRPVVRYFPAYRPVYRPPYRRVVRTYRTYPAYRPYPIYRPRPVVRYSPAYRPYPIYRSRPVVRYYPAYRPARTVCRTRFRLVRTAYGFVERPVRICTRRY